VITKNSNSVLLDAVNRQGASALLTATFGFLQANNISKQQMLDALRQSFDIRKAKANVRRFRKLVRAYEEMGIVMSTWFSLQKFLDSECHPLPLSTGRGSRSVSSLVRASRVRISTKVAIELMRQSPSISADALGNLIAMRREFVLPGFTVSRAAIVIERYLDTLHRNSSPNNRRAFLLLERNCYVPEVNLKTVVPLLRDIKQRGSAYIDSVNGDIEGLRLAGSRGRTGEMSVHIFAWTRLPKARKLKANATI